MSGGCCQDRFLFRYHRPAWAKHKFPAHWAGNSQCVKKASQSSSPAGGESSEIIFCRDMCVAENTSHPASVEFVCVKQTKPGASAQTQWNGLRGERRRKGADGGFAVRRNRRKADFAVTSAAGCSLVEKVAAATFSKRLHPAACIICLPLADKFHTCRARSIFCQVHAPAENDFT